MSSNLPDICSLSASLKMELSEDEVAAFETLGPLLADSLAAVVSAESRAPPVKYARERWSAPTETSNRLKAWSVQTDIHGAASGPLLGRTVVLKDNILLADVPLMNGSPAMHGYVPDTDATVVNRVLDAGGIIVGKAHCEPLCLGGGSHLNPFGPVHNPHRLGYSAGGSSSGVAALVASGEVELGIGGDQGGSIRMPAAFCGLVGMKPTYGLIPYTGAIPIEITLDHLGPLTRTVHDNAVLLEVLAGPDGSDPRQSVPLGRPPAHPYATTARGMRVGVLKEGFALPNLDPRVAELARDAAVHLEKCGATLRQISVPQHQLGNAVFLVIALTGFTVTLMNSDGLGVGRSDSYLVNFARVHRNWRTSTNHLSPFAKFLLLWGEHMLTRDGAIPYGVAQNLVPSLRAAYNEALRDCDMLLMPTLPIVAQPHPPPGSPTLLVMQKSIEMMGNTSQFNVTGHPALTVPCGLADGLPVGVQLVGPHYGENLLYAAAAELEAKLSRS